MWEHSLPYVTARIPAVLHGHRRSLCLYSWVYRGTRKDPGLVLGLEQDASSSTAGCILRVPLAAAESALAFFDERELINGIYRREVVECVTDSGRVAAYAYLARGEHEQYCGALTESELVRLVARGVGTRGTTLAYLDGTLRSLHEYGVHEPELERVLTAARALDSKRDAPGV